MTLKVEIIFVILLGFIRQSSQYKVAGSYALEVDQRYVPFILAGGLTQRTSCFYLSRCNKSWVTNQVAVGALLVTCGLTFKTTIERILGFHAICNKNAISLLQIHMHKVDNF